MPDKPDELAELERRRGELYAELGQVGDFRRGSLNEALPEVRKAELHVRGPGSSGSRAAVEPDAEGGRADADGSPEAGAGADKARREVAEYERFKDFIRQVTEVNEAICAARPAGPGDAGEDAPPGRAGEKGGSGTRSRRRRPPG